MEYDMETEGNIKITLADRVAGANQKKLAE
jgi:hypothetical protein